jgi:hypothetical protein
MTDINGRHVRDITAEVVELQSGMLDYLGANVIGHDARMIILALAGAAANVAIATGMPRDDFVSLLISTAEHVGQTWPAHPAPHHAH